MITGEVRSALLNGVHVTRCAEDEKVVAVQAFVDFLSSTAVGGVAHHQ